MAVIMEGRQSAVSKADLDASRLVFVYVKDTKPRRKVAVPVPESCTWEEFVAQIKSKLRISGVHSIHLTATGQKVTTLDQLQDIDELVVQEGQHENGNASESVSNAPEPPIASTTSGVPTLNSSLKSPGTVSEISPQTVEHTSIAIHRSQSLHPDRHRSTKAIDLEVIDDFDDEADKEKYVKRSNFLKRILQRLWGPFSQQSTLPISAKESFQDDKVSRRRRKQPVMRWRNLILLLAITLCLGTMLLLYFKVTI